MDQPATEAAGPWRSHSEAETEVVGAELSLGLEELLAGPGVKAIEWADRLPHPAPGRSLCGSPGAPRLPDQPPAARSPSCRPDTIAATMRRRME